MLNFRNIFCCSCFTGCFFFGENRGRQRKHGECCSFSLMLIKLIAWRVVLNSYSNHLHVWPLHWFIDYCLSGHWLDNRLSPSPFFTALHLFCLPSSIPQYAHLSGFNVPTWRALICPFSPISTQFVKQLVYRTALSVSVDVKSNEPKSQQMTWHINHKKPPLRTF